jgi:hypothetical protein
MRRPSLARVGSQPPAACATARYERSLRSVRARGSAPIARAVLHGPAARARSWRRRSLQPAAARSATALGPVSKTELAAAQAGGLSSNRGAGPESFRCDPAGGSMTSARSTCALGLTSARPRSRSSCWHMRSRCWAGARPLDSRGRPIRCSAATRQNLHLHATILTSHATDC